MKKSVLSSLKYSIFKILFFVLSGVIVFVLFMGRNSENKKLINNEPKTFDKGWYYYSKYGEKIEIPSLPVKIPAEDGISRIYHTLLPLEDGNVSLCFYSEHQDITVRLNNSVIYSFSTATHPKNLISYRSVYNLIEIPRFYEISTLCIETRTSVKSCEGLYKDILLGDRSQVLFSIVMEHISSFLLGVMFIVASIFLFCTSHLFTRSNRKDFTLLHLSLLTFCIGLWQLDDSTLLFFFTGYLPLLWCLKYMSQLFMPIFTYFFLNSIIEKPKSKFINAIFWIIIATIFVQLLLQILGIRALTDTVFMSHFIYVAICLYTVVTLFKEEWLKESRLKYLLVFSMLISVVIFTFTAFSLLNKQFLSSVMSFGLAVIFIAMILIAYQKQLKLFEAINKADTYKNLAFIDMATGVNNKTAWYTLIENFNETTRPQGEYCLIVFDMNNLKKINDKYGHLVGDKVIKSFCDCITKIVNGRGEIYRIGGDEFVCVCQNLYRENIQTMLHHFDEAVAEQEDNEFKFSAAYGYEFFTPKSPADFKIAMEKADEKMYSRKTEMKEGRE
ncbi:MAG: diguanylate cyclase [Treponema sp.]|nr:diguanylate cyclase [Treponema sp.]